jgi:hypothetical protein
LIDNYCTLQPQSLTLCLALPQPQPPAFLTICTHSDGLQIRRAATTDTQLLVGRSAPSSDLFFVLKSEHLQHVHLHTDTGVSFWAYLQSYTVAPLAVCGGLALPVFVAYVKGMRTSAKLRWRRTLDRYPASLNPDGFAGHLICTMLWLKD